MQLRVDGALFQPLAEACKLFLQWVLKRHIGHKPFIDIEGIHSHATSSLQRNHRACQGEGFHDLQETIRDECNRAGRKKPKDVSVALKGKRYQTS